MVLRPVLRLAAIGICVAIAAALDHAGMLSSMNRVIETARLELSSRQPSGDMVLVEIDSKSLSAIDTWPWPRSVHARMLDTLMAMGADEVAFDIDFSSRSTPREDAALEKSLADAGGYAFLAAFEQVSGITGQLERTRPLPAFAAQADPVLVNVILDRWSVVRAFPTRTLAADPPIRSLATALGEPETRLPATLAIDFSIDLDDVPRYSFIDVLEGRVPEGEIAGRDVVIGASAVELRDFFTTPRFGILPGALVQIAATETVRAGRVLTDRGVAPVLLALALVGLAGWIARLRTGLWTLAALAIAAMAAVEALALWLFGSRAILVDTAAFHIATPIMLALAVGEQALVWLRQRQAMQRRLEYLARYDEVSGARTRTGFIDNIELEMMADDPLCILMVEIGRLDVLVGGLGHKVADKALAEVTTRLERLAPDFTARVGDARFAIAFRSSFMSRDIAQCRERLAFSLSEPFSIEGHSVLLDVKLAGAIRTAALEDPATLLDQAEIALSETGDGNSWDVPLYSPHLAAGMAHRRQLDIDMRDGLHTGEFFLAFQPQLALRTHRLTGVEALLRWDHPGFGPVSPAEFIPLAEETGFILELGEWVLDQACRLTADWNWNGRVAVNVSSLQLEYADLKGQVKSLLSELGLPPRRLELEITESMLVKGNARRVQDLLQSFRDMDVAIAIDDFGTGYSALSYLNTLPFDTLKLDRSFVQDINADRQQRSVVETIIRLAHMLGKSVVAEGIETGGQDRTLAEMGCDIGQGFYYARPVNAHSLRERLGKRSAV